MNNDFLKNGPLSQIAQQLSRHDRLIKRLFDLNRGGSSVEMVGGNGIADTISAENSEYLTPFTTGFNTSGFSMVLSRAGTLSNFFLRTRNAQPASGTFVFTVQINSVATALVVTVPAGGGVATYSDTTNSVTVNSGDSLRVIVWNFALATSAQLDSWTIEYSH